MNEPRRVKFHVYEDAGGGQANPWRWVEKNGWLLEFGVDKNGYAIGICETEEGTLHETPLHKINTNPEFKGF